MPANLTPEYKRAEEMFRQAGSTEEKITALELMLQTIPKHKGTDHMQADLKRRLSKLKTESASKKKSGGKDLFHVPRGTSGGQVCMLGTPNSGKSSILAYTTHAHVQVADYPFSTIGPVPGIMMHEDVPIQLVDMPPITPEHVEPGQIGAYRQCDLILVNLDLSAVDVTEEWEVCLDFLRQRNFILPENPKQDEDVFKHLLRPCLAACTKTDLARPGDYEVMQELCADTMPMTRCSIHEPESLKQLAFDIFKILDIVRIYSKLPGKEAELKDPFTLPCGSTVFDLALKVHRELAENLKFARIWGEGKYPGQQVPRDYILQDKDVIELHFH
ncbi:MAG: TGS domain-containing protein [Sedimentisphaerales bacterium]|nr:TGS domain-containing protein [Sedimentisphaerales bacterium]